MEELDSVGAKQQEETNRKMKKQGLDGIEERCLGVYDYVFVVNVLNFGFVCTPQYREGVG